jgi:SAM-dependent methyltransferase
MVEEFNTRSGVNTETLMVEKPAGSESPTIAEAQTGVAMPKRTIALVLGALLLAGVAAMWAFRARRNPAACPYSQRLLLDLPRPFMRRQTLRDMLDLAPGERVLEVGAGTGYYSLDVARQIAPDGRLDVLDLQQSMLDELMRRAAKVGAANVVATQGDACGLPFPAATFDTAFLVATLGEIPDRDQALRELRRVLKSGGRLVVGEGQPDPHMLTIDELRCRAEAIGFVFDGHEGTPFGYFARFRSG